MQGFQASCEKGPLLGQKVMGVKMTINDGDTHLVDSSEMAFKIAVQQAMRKAFKEARPQVLEPIMKVVVTSPAEFQGAIVGLMNKRNAVIDDTEIGVDDFVLYAECGLHDMFGFSTVLRAATQGKGEFTMEFLKYSPALPQHQADLVNKYEKEEKAKK